MSDSGWIGVDLDGTLAEYHGWGDGSIGKPIPAMVERVKRWLAGGREVRIMTARVWAPRISFTFTAGDVDDGDERIERAKRRWGAEEQHRLIDEWCIGVFGRPLPVTYMKDCDMIELWDDRAIQVEKNTGRPIGCPACLTLTPPSPTLTSNED